MGWSYGGYMTSMIITKTNRFKAASSVARRSDANDRFTQTTLRPNEPKLQIAAMQANLDWFEKYLK